MKKILAIFLTLVLSLSCIIVGNAAEEIVVVINGSVIDFDVPPQIIDDRTMVPVRKAFESLGAKVDWSEEMSLAIATYKTEIITIQIGEMSFSVTNVLTNETRVIKCDVPAQIVDGRTLIPLRAIAEALGKDVKWDGDTRTAYINDMTSADNND